MSDMKSLSGKIEKWLKAKAGAAGAKGAVLGLSGGIDSAVVAAIAKKVFGKNALAIIMPCHSSDVDIKDARSVARALKIKAREIDLTKIFDVMVKVFGTGKIDPRKKDMALSNLKPRLRMMTLYYFANKNNYLVLGTGNKSELTMGYFTKYGDGGVDLLPIGSFLKRQVRGLAFELKIPEKIIFKPPTAGLWKGQTDEGEMGITYSELDAIIHGLERKNTKGFNKKLVNKVKMQYTKTKHKRMMPEVFEL